VIERDWHTSWNAVVEQGACIATDAKTGVVHSGSACPHVRYWEQPMTKLKKVWCVMVALAVTAAAGGVGLIYYLIYSSAD
jgi:hypothetical protein